MYWCPAQIAIHTDSTNQLAHGADPVSPRTSPIPRHTFRRHAPENEKPSRSPNEEGIESNTTLNWCRARRGTSWRDGPNDGVIFNEWKMFNAPSHSNFHPTSFRPWSITNPSALRRVACGRPAAGPRQARRIVTHRVSSRVPPAMT